MDNLKKLKVYVWTANKQMCCLPAWAYLFNKFWPIKTEVGIIGYDLPNFKLPDNFTYTSLGEQRGPEYFTEDMLKFFKEKQDECFYLTTEDGFIVKPVKKYLIEFIADVVFENKNDNFLRFCLTSDVQKRPHDVIKDYGDFHLITSNQNSDYRQSLQHSIWYGKTFTKLLETRQSPWQFEMNQSAKNNNMNVFATKGLYAIHCGHGYKQGKKIDKWYDDCNDNSIKLESMDINFIEAQGWVPEL